jgi:hypothetical protein
MDNWKDKMDYIFELEEVDTGKYNNVGLIGLYLKRNG